MTNEELAAIRTVIREETNASEQRVRALMREEINAAVYASEQRLGERLDRVERHVGERLDKFEERLGKLEATTASMDERLHRVEVLQKQMAVNLAQSGSVLEEATIKINELQMSYIGLDQKVEGIIKRDLQKLTYTVRNLMDNVALVLNDVSLRLNMHKDTPINEAHPHSAA